MTRQNKHSLFPNIHNDSLTQKIEGLDQDNNRISTKIIKEGALTIFLNKQEIVTLMCILDHPIYLAIGYLLNQNMSYSFCLYKRFFLFFYFWTNIMILFCQKCLC